MSESVDKLFLKLYQGYKKYFAMLYSHLMVADKEAFTNYVYKRRGVGGQEN